jgi:hypothetical protein
MPPVTRSRAKPIPTAEEIAAAAAANAAIIEGASQPVKKIAPKKNSAPKKTTTKRSRAVDSSTEPSKKKKSTGPAPKKRKAKHSFTLHIDYVYWDEDTDDPEYEHESFTGTKADANRYFKQYLEHIKSKDSGDFGRRNFKIGKLERDEKGLFKFEYDDMPSMSRRRELMSLNMYLTMEAEDTKVPDDE